MSSSGITDRSESETHILRELSLEGAKLCTRGRNTQGKTELTHVDFFLLAIVDDFEETDNVGMAELFHDSNFFLDFELCGSELVDHGGF
jgi:hypothetical protein